SHASRRPPRSWAQSNADWLRAQESRRILNQTGPDQLFETLSWILEGSTASGGSSRAGALWAPGAAARYMATVSSRMGTSVTSTASKARDRPAPTRWTAARALEVRLATTTGRIACRLSLGRAAVTRQAVPAAAIIAAAITFQKAASGPKDASAVGSNVAMRKVSSGEAAKPSA